MYNLPYIDSSISSLQTHEEAVTEMIASLGHLSYRQLPLLLYQVSTKFRDEAKPRSGLLRAREFLMKDLYSFDTNLKGAQSTYSIIKDAYHRIFSELGVHYVTGKCNIMTNIDALMLLCNQ
jgi:prolyl-tRNA synthetase